MTLEDKMYRKIDMLSFGTHSQMSSVAKACAAIAKQEAIEFAEFVVKFQHDSTPFSSDYSKSPADLYTLFQKTR